MGTEEFLNHVLPDEGEYCSITIPKGRPPRQKFNHEISHIIKSTQQLEHYGVDVYFACASFKDNSSRSACNAHRFKSLWIDLDVGDKSAYSDKPSARSALGLFCIAAKLPLPTLVDSGNGYHVYWTLTKSVGYDVWQPLAAALLAKAVEHDFKIKDPGITTDAARILRIPGTKNYKDPITPKNVKLLGRLQPPTEPEELGNLLQVQLFPAAKQIIPRVPVTSGKLRSSATQALMGYVAHNFNSILDKTLRDEGCVHLAHAYMNQDDLGGFYWWGVLSIAKHCSQRDLAIHNMSYQHDNYTVSYTEDKTGRTDAPYSCAAIDVLNPGLCSTCRHCGSITFPFLVDKPPPPSQDLALIPEEMQGVDLPPYPFPYFRGTVTGLYSNQWLQEENKCEKKPIYAHDIYVPNRHHDPGAGETVHVCLSRPFDGVSDFTIALSDLTAADKCREVLSKQGIAVGQTKMKELMKYLTDYTSHLQTIGRAEKIRTQFGWHDDHTVFVIGDREITKDEINYAMPSRETSFVVPMFTKVGSLEEWKSVANLYAGPNNEVRAFTLFLGLGSPVFKFFNYGGAILHLTNIETGVGKSSAQSLACSVWGHPIKGMVLPGDTQANRMHRLGIMNNVIFCVDEITNMNEEEVSDLAFAVSNGRGRGRMEASANVERKNNTTWSTPCITSGNNSIHDKLMNNKLSAQGEIMRVLEMRVEAIAGIKKEKSDHLFTEVLMNNYGHAGENIVQYIMNNRSETQDRIKQIQRDFDKAAGFSQPDRFYSAMVATALWGGEIANQLNLINIPVAPVSDYLLHFFKNIIHDTRTPIELCSQNLSTFLNEHMPINSIVISSTADTTIGSLGMPDISPRSELMIRKEPDTNLLYISISSLRNWCSKRRASYGDITREMTACGALVDYQIKTLAHGTALAAGAVRTVVFDIETLKKVGVIT